MSQRTAQDAADMAASSIDISNMTSEDIDEADTAATKQCGVDAVQRCYACSRTGHISSNCPYGCRHCKEKPKKGTGRIDHKDTCPEKRQGRSITNARAGMKAQPGAGFSNRPRPVTPTGLRPRSQSPALGRCPSPAPGR